MKNEVKIKALWVINKMLQVVFWGVSIVALLYVGALRF
jgi:hypothetical protein